MRVNQMRTTEEELETDNGDDYMAESIAEAEKEVKEKKGSIDMQKEIKQLEEDSEVKGTKMSEDMDIAERKHINKLTDQLTSEALESKSVLEYNGKEFDVKQDKEQQEHSNFLSYNKEAIHEAYLDMRKELGVGAPASAAPEEQPEKKVVKKTTHDDNSLTQKKSEEKIEEKTEEKTEEEEASESESESNSESDNEDDSEGRKKKKKPKKGKGKKKKTKMKGNKKKAKAQS